MPLFYECVCMLDNFKVILCLFTSKYNSEFDWGIKKILFKINYFVVVGCFFIFPFCIFLDLPNNKWTECQFCKMVITTVNLWRHIRTQHTPQPPRKCELYNKNFKNKYSLREHIRISHEQKLALRTEN